MSVVSELAQLDPNAHYAIFSQKLFSSLYPANTILLRKDKFSVWDRGQTEAWDVDPAIATLSGRVLHDDWNPTKQ
jgi:hypothetical protein